MFTVGCELWRHDKRSCLVAGMKSQIVEIVDIVSLKFDSDEAAGWKADILEPLFYSQ